MSEPIVKLDEPKKNFDWQDVQDLMDEVGRHIDGLKKTIMELEEGNQGWILLDELRRKEIRELKKRIEFLEGA
jgi:hypothetical protein